MTFSGDFDAKEIIKIVKDLLDKEGFKLNSKKISILTKKNRQQVTGIVVNKKLNIRKNYKRKIRQEMYYINKLGLEEHLKKLNITDLKSYILKLIGKINFVLQVDTNNKEFIKYKTLLSKNELE